MAFREANVPTDPKKPVQSVSGPKKEDLKPISRPTDAPDEGSDLLATYQEESGRPYTAEYFNIENLWSEPELAEPLGRIETYLQEQVAEKKLANSTKAADKLLKKLEKKAEIDSTIDDPDIRIDKLNAYIGFLRIING